MSKPKDTGAKAASSASKTLTNSAIASKSKTAAASALSQTKTLGKTTSSKAASAASKTLFQKASQVKSPAKTGKVSLTAARSAVMVVNKSRGKK